MSNVKEYSGTFKRVYVSDNVSHKKRKPNAIYNYAIVTPRNKKGSEQAEREFKYTGELSKLFPFVLNAIPIEKTNRPFIKRIPKKRGSAFWYKKPKAVQVDRYTRGVFSAMCRFIDELADQNFVCTDMKPANMGIRDKKFVMLDIDARYCFKVDLRDSPNYKQYFKSATKLIALINTIGSDLSDLQTRIGPIDLKSLFPYSIEFLLARDISTEKKNEIRALNADALAEHENISFPHRVLTYYAEKNMERMKEHDKDPSRFDNVFRGLDIPLAVLGIPLSEAIYEKELKKQQTQEQPEKPGSSDQNHSSTKKKQKHKSNSKSSSSSESSSSKSSPRYLKALRKTLSLGKNKVSRGLQRLRRYFE